MGTFNLTLSEDDKRWLKGEQPGLQITQKDGVLIARGVFHVDREYKTLRLADDFQVVIEFQPSQFSDIPKVIETGGRPGKITRERKIPLADLHFYDVGSEPVACLCVRFEEQTYLPRGFVISTYVKKLVEPFFYAQKYFSEFNRWPWPTYAHGVWGWLEWYAKTPELSKQDVEDFANRLTSTNVWPTIKHQLFLNGGVKGHYPCYCGSTKRYRDCHEKVFHGLWKLRHDIKRFAQTY